MAQQHLAPPFLFAPPPPPPPPPAGAPDRFAGSSRSAAAKAMPQSSCTTDVDIYQARYTWTIRRFLDLRTRATVVWKVDEEDLKFKICLNPHHVALVGADGYDEFVSVFLFNRSGRNLDAGFSIALPRAEGGGSRLLTPAKKCKAGIKEWAWSSDESVSSGRGFHTFVKRSKLVDENLLVDGALTLVFELEGVGDVKHTYSKPEPEQLIQGAVGTLGSAFEGRLYAPSPSTPARTRGADGPALRAFQHLAEPPPPPPAGSWKSGGFDHSDVVLRCKDEEFSAHKVILAARSDVFRAMFSSLADFEENKRNRVDIPDTTPAALELFLRYLYTDTLGGDAAAGAAAAANKPKSKTIADLLELADKYDVESLKTICARELISTMCVHTAAEIAVLGQLHSMPALKNRAVSFICSNASAVMETDGWKRRLMRAAPEICQDVILATQPPHAGAPPLPTRAGRKRKASN